MNVHRVALVVVLASAVVTVARSGHELPVYPSYYPHEIEIQALAPERAAALLIDGKLHAYLGSEPRFATPPPEHLRSIESLGSFIVVRLNPSSPPARDDAAACAAVGTLARTILTRGDIVAHPYPVTPWHGDYLHHVDLAEAAKGRLLGGATSVAGLKVRVQGPVMDLIPPGQRATGADWDAEIAEVRLADLLAPHSLALNGWQGPWWQRAGWFHARLLLAEPSRRFDDQVRRLEANEFGSPAERINAERALVTALTASCRAIVAGYRVRRETVNTEFSAGIENLAFDALDGFNSPIFLRTAKLKDFPWNGWLSLGIEGRPQAAWNPIAGFTDSFGRLLWSAVGDPAAIPSPYEEIWMLNRITDVDAGPRIDKATP